jgi:ABC-type uncharacterized transport system permease subunit
MHDRAWMFAGALLYTLAVATALTNVLRRRPPPHGLIYAVIAVGCLAQTFGLWLRGMAVGSCPIGNPFEMLQFVAWSCIVVFLCTGPVFRLSLLGAACATMAAAVSLLSILLPSWDHVPRGNFFGGNPWIESHAALAFFSYGVLALLAALGGMYLLQDYSLRRKRYPAVFRLLPSIVEMDGLLQRLLILGCAIFSIALGIGAVYWLRHPDAVSWLKIGFTLLLWLACVAVLAWRLAGRLAGACLARACLLLFAAALLTLWPIQHNRSLQPAAADAADATPATDAPAKP